MVLMIPSPFVRLHSRLQSQRMPAMHATGPLENNRLGFGKRGFVARLLVG